MKTPVILIGLAVLGAIFLTGCSTTPPTPTDSPQEVITIIPDSPTRGKDLVDPSELLGGGPAKDGIPSIDNPKFVTVEEADEWIDDDELVLALEHKGVKRVYPYQIMVWHEIVNDVVAGDPLLITYCPLCGSGIAYERVIDGEPVEFGTSGKLYNSNLVMYDRKTDSYWTQIGGRAIIGELSGTILTPLAVDTVEWGAWKAAHPDSEVLSKDTGQRRNYGADPYASGFPRFPVDNEDDTLGRYDVIFGIEVNGTYKAYPERVLLESPAITDEVNGIPVKVERDEAGVVKIFNTDSDEEIIKERDFWFAWVAFHPETEVYLP